MKAKGYGLFVVVGVLIFGIVYLGSVLGNQGTIYLPSGGDQDQVVTTNLCGTDNQGTGQFVYLNTLNTASTEYLSVSGYLYKDDVLTTTTAKVNDTSITFNCDGGVYKLEILSSSTNAGRTILIGEVKADQVPDLIVSGAQEDAIKVKAYDLNNAGWVYTTASATTAYSNANVTFNSTTENAAYDWSTNGGVLDYRLDLRTQSTDTEFGDIQDVVCVYYSGTELNAPEVINNGRSLGSGDLYGSADDPQYDQIATDNPLTAGSTVCYKIANIKGDSTSTVEVRLEQKSGQTATTDAHLYLYAKGKYQKLDGKTIANGVYTDATTKTYAGRNAQTIKFENQA